MPFWLAALIRFASDFLARVVKDARRDAELKRAGRDAERVDINEAAADAERKSAAVPDRTESETLDRLDKGGF
jgi:hypothetical protein